MASYDVALTSSAEKELKKLPGQLIARIVPRLETLASNPRPSGCKKLRAVVRNGASVWVTTAWYTIDDARVAGGSESPEGGLRTMIAGDWRPGPVLSSQLDRDYTLGPWEPIMEIPVGESASSRDLVLPVCPCFQQRDPQGLSRLTELLSRPAI
jgi:hypothetical protein